MGRKRIHLGNASHRSHKGRTYRTTGTYLVAVLIGVCNKLLCDHIENSKAVLDYRSKLTVKTFRNKFRNRIAVDRLAPFP